MTTYQYVIQIECKASAPVSNMRKLADTTVRIDTGYDDMLEHSEGFTETGYKVALSMMATAISRLCQHAAIQGHQEGQLIGGVIRDLEGFLTDIHRTDVEVSIKKKRTS